DQACALLANWFGSELGVFAMMAGIIEPRHYRGDRGLRRSRTGGDPLPAWYRALRRRCTSSRWRYAAGRHGRHGRAACRGRVACRLAATLLDNAKGLKHSAPAALVHDGHAGRSPGMGTPFWTEP